MANGGEGSKKVYNEFFFRKPAAKVLSFVSVVQLK